MASGIILGGSLDETANQQHRLPFPDGKLLFEDQNFDDGYRGWEDFYTPSGNTGAVLSLTPTMTFGGGLGLRLSTSSKRTTVIAGNCFAIKRMTRPNETGTLIFETVYSFGAETLVGAEEKNGNPFDVEFMIDTCNFAGTHRSFAHFRHCLVDGTSFVRVNELRSRKNEVGGATAYRNSGITTVPILNQNKLILNRAVVAFNLAGNGGLGEYAFFEVNGTRWTMEGTEAGEAAEEAIQGGGDVGNFAGGLNFIIGLNGNSHEDVGHSWLNVASTRAYLL
jgi:hypothetical protein